MNKRKGAISIFALLSMMFFLIFIMVAYNNVAQKGKTQVETEEILVSYYKSPRTASEVVNALNGGSVANGSKNTAIKGTDLQNKATVGSYVLSNGKYYLIGN